MEAIRIPPLSTSQGPLARFDGSRQLWILNAVLVAVALVIGAFLAHLRPPVQVLHLSWWSLAPLFYLAEIWVVPLTLRRDPHVFSFREIPVILGLFFCAPSELMLAQAIGAGAAVIIHRRQPPAKLVLGVAQTSLSVALAAMIFDSLAGTSALPRDPVTWPAAFLATIGGAGLGILLLAAGQAVSAGHDNLRRISTLVVIGSLTNTSLALAGLVILGGEPAAVGLLAIPALTLIVASYAYQSIRRKQKNVEFLYESSRLLHHSTELEPTVLAILSYLKGMFRAEQAEITLLRGPGERPTRISLRPDSEPELLEAVDVGPLETVLARMESLPDHRHSLQNDPDVGTYLSSRGFGHTLVAPLTSQRHPIGIIALGNPLAAGDFDRDERRLFKSLADHVGALLEAGGLEQSLSQVRQLEAELRHQADHDGLTQLGNRGLFLDRVGQALQRWERTEHPVAVLILDLDDFQAVNERLGPVAGDQILAQVAERLRSCLRSGDTAARLGGDEFAILIEEVVGVARAKLASTRVLAALSTPFEIRGQEIRIEASVGIAIGRPDSIWPEELVRNADIAMRSAKSNGKAKIQVFEPGMEARVLDQHQLRADLQAGLERGEFTLHYQPIVRIATGTISGFEALIRWIHPTRGPIAPLDFIPLAEETGFINELGAWILSQACWQAATWKTGSRVDRDLTMSVNLSARQLQNPRLVSIVAEALESSGLDPACLILEITENAMIEDTQGTLAQFERLKALGVRLAIDDFGTGYSSLSWLRRFPVDILKIAKPFVDGLGSNPNETAFLRAIADLGQTMEMEMVAEGIEKPIQVEQLRALKLVLGQGFYYAMPLTSIHAEQLLDSGPLGAGFAFA